MNMYKPILNLTRTISNFKTDPIKSKRFIDYYKILGLGNNFSQSELNNLYLKNADKYHPDTNSNPDAFEKFMAISQGYEILKTSAKKKRYDSLLKNYKSLIPEPSFVETIQEIRIDPITYFRKMHSDKNQQWDDEPKLRVTFVEAVLGATKQMVAKDCVTCKHCAYNQSHKSFVICEKCLNKGFLLTSKPIKVVVPPGTKNNSEVKAEFNQNEIKIKLEVKPDDRYTRLNDDLHINIPITIDQALVGREIKFNHLDGSEITLKFKPGTKYITKMGKGVINTNRPPGNLHIHFIIEHPIKRTLLTQIAAIFAEKMNNPNDSIENIKMNTMDCVENFFEKLNDTYHY